MKRVRIGIRQICPIHNISYRPICVKCLREKFGV